METEANRDPAANRPTAEEAAAALREAEQARSSVTSIAARPWFYPTVAALSAVMTVGMLMLSSIGIMIVVVIVTGLVMLSNRHEEIVGVREKKGSGLGLRDIAVVAPGIAIYVVAGASYSRSHQVWQVVVAAVAIAGTILLLGFVRNRRARR